METGLLRGIAAFRWAAWFWVAIVTVANHRQLDKPVLAYGLLSLALAITVWLTLRLRAASASLLDRAPLIFEFTCGFALTLCDGWAYGPGHVFATSQSLGVAWPMAGVLSIGVALGVTPGGIAGAGIGLARLGATFANGVAAYQVTGGRVMSLISTAVLYASAGAVAGYCAQLLRRAEGEVSTVRAREEFARTLHDGVLQTLAVVERRTDDPALARLAREQERDLREYLFGSSPTTLGGGGDLGTMLRAAAGRFEDNFGGRAQVLIADDLPVLPATHVDALAGAVGEALTNAGKHGHAAHITVFVEPDGSGVFGSVQDDGGGFDLEAVTEGVGLTRSIRDRVHEVGGRAEIRSQPGEGTEVLMWIP